MTAYARRSYAGGAILSTIPTGMGSTDTTFTLATGTATNWPSGSGGNFVVVVDQASPEKILCSGLSGLVVTVASGGRGYDGSSAVAHSPNCVAQVVHCAQDDDEANQVVAGVLGQSGAAKGDILYMNSAAGPNTLSRLGLDTTVGHVIGTDGTVPKWGYPALTPAAGHLASPVALGINTPTKIFDTASLAVGTWLIQMGTTVSGADVGAIEVHAAVDSATATLTGQTSAGQSNIASDERALSISFIAVVTVAGTLQLIGESSNGSGATAEATSGVYALTNVTGYTALRIA